MTYLYIIIYGYGYDEGWGDWGGMYAFQKEELCDNCEEEGSKWEMRSNKGPKRGSEAGVGVDSPAGSGRGRAPF